jgi:hypothetical protein
MVNILSWGHKFDLEGKINSDEWNVQKVGTFDMTFDSYVLPILPEVLVYASIHIKGAYVGANYFEEQGRTETSDDIKFGVSGNYYKIQKK